MGRVKPSQMREGAKVQGGSSVPYFKFDMGKKYKVVFPTIAGEKDVFAYMEAAHKVTVNGRFSTIRCVNAKYQVSEESRLAVVRTGEDGELLKDPSSGRVLNDGTCPMCELEYLYRQWVFTEVEKFKEENPNATDKDISAKYRELFDKAPVEPVYKRDKETGEITINTTKVLLGVVYTLDESNKYILDASGNPVFDIQIFNLSDSRYNKILAVAENNKEYISKELEEITDEFGLAWVEFSFDFPKADDKADSGKNLTISAIPMGRSAVETYPGTREAIQEAIGDGTKYEEIFENLGSLKVRSIPEIEKDLQGKVAEYRSLMSKEEKEELVDRLSADEKVITGADASKLLDKEVAEVESKEDAVGEDVFLG